MINITERLRKHPNPLPLYARWQIRQMLLDPELNAKLGHKGPYQSPKYYHDRYYAGDFSDKGNPRWQLVHH